MRASENMVPIKKGLWTTLPSGEARLLGSRCPSCGELFFPRKTGGNCTRCQERKLEAVELGPLGRIDSFTAVLQPPAGGFYHGPVPFCYGLIDLDEGLRVETHISGSYEALKHGLRVKLVVETMYTDQEGNHVQVFSFAPLHEQGGAA